VPTGAIVTLLFTSLASSTELLDRLGDIAFGELRQMHLRLLRTAVASSHGEEVKNLGDGLMVVFTSAVDGVVAAVEMQRAVERHNQASESETFLVRIGLHVGEPIAEEADYFGSPVVIARRLCDRAEPGEILASALVRDLVGTRGSFEFSDVGPLELKGFAQPLPACAIGWRAEAEAEAGRALALPGALVHQQLETFVGRDRELERLTAVWDDVAAGGRRAVLVAGEPGIGKTRLASEAALTALAAGGRVLYGRCDEDPALPYQPFVEALRDLLGESAALVTAGPGTAQLALLLPELGGSPSGTTKPEPGADRYALFETVVELLVAESRRRPLVLVLDDLQWAPKPTVLLLRHLLRHAAPMSLLVIGTYRDTEIRRDDPLAELLADLRRDPNVERIALTGLDEDGVTAFAEAMPWPDMPPVAELGRTLHAETGGNPFFVREVILHLRGRDLNATDVEGLRGVGLPDSVRDVVSRRLGQLSAAAQRCLQLAAVIGASFEVGILESVAEPALDPDTVLDALDEAVHAGVIAEDGWTYRFSHELIRQTVYGEMLTARRAQLHGRVAEAIEASPVAAQRVSELAHHYSLATQVHFDSAIKAVEYGSRAGREAMKQLAYEQAADHFDRALAMLDTLASPDDARRVELLIDAAGAARAVAEPLRSMELAQRAADIADGLGARELLARAALTFEESTWVAQGFMDQDAMEPAITLLRRALETVGPDSPLRVELLTRLPRVLYFTAPPEEKLRYADEAAEHAQRLADPGIKAAVAEARRWALWGTGDLGAQLAVSMEMLEHAEAAADPQLQVRAHVWLYLAHLDLGNLAEAETEIAALEELGRSLRDPLAIWYPKAGRAVLALLEGRIVDAESHALEAFVAADRADLDWAITSFGIQMYFVRREQGALAELEEPTRRLTERLTSIPAVRCALADLYCHVGKLDDARQVFEQFAATGFDLPRDLGWMVCMGMLADVAGALVDVERAATLYQLLLPYADTNLVVSPGIACMGSTSRSLGVLAATVGDWDRAAAHFEAALAFNARLGAAPGMARTALDWAAMLAKRGDAGDADRARSLATDAARIADERDLRNVRDLAASFLGGLANDD
jgi:class 3 adenylate cyclase/tetratricopeptide (TPR) repeat protein